MPKSVLVSRTVTKVVTHCGECPFYQKGMDVGDCLHVAGPSYVGYRGIHPDCPYLKQKRERINWYADKG